MNQVGSAGVISVNEPLRDLMNTWVVPRRHFAPGSTLFLYSSGNVGGTARIRPSSGIITTLMAGLSLMTAFAVIVLMTMYAPQHCSQNAALWTLLVSILVLVVWMTIPASHILPHVIYAEWIACVGTFCLVSLVERAPIPAVERIR
ncbi:hypothetical protein SAMN02910343_01384 [Dialister histaminiformans]|uniref:Uncharacterized protein n=1 Tax=Allisonella histaminiformans TaxID=209880 RepID=A0A1G5WHT8_9FIRM|nr:hypothetical protein SAMN02910343_01384 [Allisonella histaminiformans]